MKQKFNIEGMSCSACSASVEKAVRRVPGVTRADVSLLDGSMVCELEEAGSVQSVVDAVSRAGFSATVASAKSKTEKTEKPERKYTGTGVRLGVSVACTLPLMYVAMGHMLSLPLSGYFHRPENAVAFFLIQLLLTLPVLYVNRVFFLRGFPALLRGSANMDSLVAIGSSAAVIYGVASFFAAGAALGAGNFELVMKYMQNLYFESAAMILTLVTVGKFLEERAKKKTGRALARLVGLSPSTARVIRDGKEITVDASALVVGDIIVLRPGESVPADGVIIEGMSSFDRSALTGESVPVDMTVGDSVMTATINLNGSVRMRAERVGEDTTLSRIIGLVRDAGASKAPAARLADKISGIFVPVVISVALLAAVIWLICGYDIGFALGIGISVLVVSCPCALGLATPVAVTVAVGRCASDGVLIKSAEALERFGRVDTAVFDKTGTLTEGKPSVTDVITADGVSEDDLLRTAAALEAGSEHPLSRAITGHWQGELPPVSGFKAVFGRGVTATVEGVSVCGGSGAYMTGLGVDISELDGAADKLAADGKTPLYFERGGKLAGIIAVADTLKSDSIQAVRELRRLGVRVVMLTGDNSVTAGAIGRRLGIDETIPDVLPQDKEAVIRRLRDEGHTVAMIGDGINDSPALTRADIGISPAAGTDIAIDSADVILMNNELLRVPETLMYSRRVVRNIRQNLFWAFFYNTLGIPVAAGVLFPAFGITLNPMIAAAAMSLSSLFVVSNALRLYRRSYHTTAGKTK